MHRIGEVDGGRALWKGDDAALGREAEYLVEEEFELGVFEKFLGVVALGKLLDGAPQRGIDPALVVIGVFLVLVEGVGCNAVFVDVVHFPGADLQFDALLAGADHRGVDRAVVVLLRGRDEVLEAAGHHRPGLVNDSERAVAFLQRLDDDAETENVGKLLEAQRLRLHLAEHRPGLFLPAAHGGIDAFGLQLGGQFLDDAADMGPVALCEVGQMLGNRLIGFRIDVLEGKFLKLVAQVLHADAAGKRRIDLHGFLGDARALVRLDVMQRAHVVQPVGEFHQQHADIVGNRQQQAAQILGLFGLLGHEIDALELGQAFDQIADAVAEHLVDLGARCVGILDGVVQQRDRDRLLVEMQIGQDGGDFQGMGKIGIAIGTALLAMLFHGIDVGLVEQGLVCVRFVAGDPLYEFILAHQWCF